MNLRVSSTTLESFRRLVQTDYGDQSDLIASIMGKPFEPSWQMNAESAWQAVLERPAEHRQFDETDTAYYRSGDYTFDGGAVGAALKHIGPGLCEVKATREFDVFGCPVTVVAQVDHVRGLFLQENKAKFSPADPKDYEPSLQWRFYLAVHGAACLRYNLFSFADPRQGYCQLRDVVSFRFWPYAELELECRQWLLQFLDFAHQHRLTPYLSRTGSTPALEEAAA